ncbi:MAG: NUDIX hydrolase [Dehalococcoidia bacterium]
MSCADFNEKYPELFGKIFWKWGPITAQFSLTTQAPPPSQISNVRIVPFVGDQVVVIDKSELGNWDHPVGTLEPGENWQNALHREAMEEAGARVDNFEVFGRLSCASHNPQPFRSHLPYPEFDQVVVWADVELSAQNEPPTTESHEHIEWSKSCNFKKRFHDLAVEPMDHGKQKCMRLLLSCEVGVSSPSH